MVGGGDPTIDHAASMEEEEASSAKEEDHQRDQVEEWTCTFRGF